MGVLGSFKLLFPIFPQFRRWGCLLIGLIPTRGFIGEPPTRILAYVHAIVVYIFGISRFGISSTILSGHFPVVL